MFGLWLDLGSCTGYVVENRLGSTVLGYTVGCMLEVGCRVAGKAVGKLVVGGRVVGKVGCRSVVGYWYRRPAAWGWPRLLLSCCYGHDHNQPGSPTAVPPFSSLTTI